MYGGLLRQAGRRSQVTLPPYLSARPYGIGACGSRRRADPWRGRGVVITAAPTFGADLAEHVNAGGAATYRRLSGAECPLPSPS